METAVRISALVGETKLEMADCWRLSVDNSES